MNNNSNCLFCKIVNKEIPSYQIYEDNDFIAILDIMPIKKYHILVIPKKHYENFNDMDNILLEKSIKVLKMIMKKIQEVYGIKDFNVTTNIGKKSGQEIFHMHWHIIPHEHQRTSHLFEKRLNIKKDVMENIAKNLKINFTKN